MTVLRPTHFLASCSPSGFSVAQLELDSLQEGFSREALNPSSLLGMLGAGFAFRAGRALSLGVRYSFLSPFFSRITSNLIGFGTEVFAFEGITRSSRILLEGADRSLLRWDGEQGFRQGLVNCALSLGSLKLSGHIFQTPYFLLQHFVQDTAMVASHQAAAWMNWEARPTGSLAQQYLHAEATLLQMNVGMNLFHMALPGFRSLERNFDTLHSLELTNESSRFLPTMSEGTDSLAEKTERLRKALLDSEKRQEAAEEYDQLAPQFPEDSAELLSEFQNIRLLFPEIKTPQSERYILSAYESLTRRLTTNSLTLRTEATILRSLFKNTAPHVQKAAIGAYRDLSSRLSGESEEVLAGANDLRELFENNNDGIARAAKHAYRTLSAHFEKGSPEIFKGTAALRKSLAQKDLDSAAGDTYEELCTRMTAGSPEVMLEAQALRRLLNTPNTNKRNLLRAYLAISPLLTKGSLEITRGTESLRQLLLDSDSDIQDGARKAYIALIPHFSKASPEVVIECRGLFSLLTNNRESVRRNAEKCFRHFFQLLSPGQISEFIGTCNIDFRDGGNSLSTLKLLLERLTDKPSIDEAIAISDHEEVTHIKTSLEEFLDSQNVHNRTPEQLGRSQVYTLESGAVLVVKYLREGQDPRALRREIQWLRRLRESNLELQSTLPINVFEGNSLLQFPDGRQAIAFTTDRSYYRYLDDPKLKDSEFMEGLCKALHDINLLARYSVFHTAPIAAFHNIETAAANRETGDQGRYVISPDLVFALGNRRGMGRLDNWPQAIRFGNLGLSGMRDAEELATLDEVIKNIKQWAPELENLTLQAHAKTLYQTLLLGNTYLAATLYIGNRIAEASKTYAEQVPYWQNDIWLETYADQLLEVYATGHAAFRKIPLDQARENLRPRADWMRLARRMAFFMTPAYVPYVRENALVRNFPAEIYDANVFVQGFGTYRKGTFDEHLGFIGPSGDPTQLSLGPVNGQNPLKEFERALAATLIESI